MSCKRSWTFEDSLKIGEFGIKMQSTRIQRPVWIMVNGSLCEFQKTQLVIISDFMEAIFHVQARFWQGSLLNKVSLTADVIGKSQVRWTCCKVLIRWSKNRYGCQ